VILIPETYRAEKSPSLATGVIAADSRAGVAKKTLVEKA
jgi:hypothetical protein